MVKRSAAMLLRSHHAGARLRRTWACHPPVLKLNCVEPTADVNDNGFADLRDYATLQNCFSGPSPTVCDPACYLLGLDSDDDIDADDHANLVDMMTWP